MKKVVLLIIFVFLMIGCTHSENTNKTLVKEDTFVLKKVDETKDYVYLSDYKSVLIDNVRTNYQIPVINIVSDEVDNVNLELKSFVVKSYKDSKIVNGVLNSGKIINYTNYVNDKYITIIQTYYNYLNGVVGEKSDNVYVVSLDTGKVLNNEEILKRFNLDKDNFYKELENKLNSDDVSFTLMNIKNNGYKLFINNEEKLGIIYYEVTDYDTERKELVLN